MTQTMHILLNVLATFLFEEIDYGEKKLWAVIK
jgi:hypothetical protein